MEKINKIDKFLAREHQDKKEDTNYYMRNDRGDRTTDFTDIKRILREYYEQLSDTKFDNLDEMDRLLERHKIQKLTQEEIGTVNSPPLRKLDL